MAKKDNSMDEQAEPQEAPQEAEQPQAPEQVEEPSALTDAEIAPHGEAPAPEPAPEPQPEPEPEPEAAPESAPDDAVLPPSAPAGPPLVWQALIPQDVADSPEARAAEHEWQLEHNPGYDNQFAPK
jgi:hypothetical protein